MFVINLSSRLHPRAGDRAAHAPLLRTLALVGAILALGAVASADIGPPPPPTVWALAAPDPGPFCPVTSSTLIRFDVPRLAHVRMDILRSGTGGIVKHLTDSNLAAGHFAMSWDGRDDFGGMLLGGTWSCRMLATDAATSDTLYLAVEPVGIDCEGVTGVGTPGASRSAWLAAGNPNPFRAKTTITFSIPRDLQVSVEIFDLSGRHVRMLERGRRPSGIARLEWDGRNDAGVEAASGMYVCVLRAGGQVLSRKLLRVRD